MLRFTCLLFLTVSCFAQFDPEGAQVNLYFPHLADGGPAADQWQTTFVFVNPHPTLPAHVVLAMYGDTGQPLALDLGGGGKSVQAVTIAPAGSATLRSSISFPTTVTGYAEAFSDLPLQATVLFRRIVKGVPQVELSASATLPTQQYFSPATRNMGVAMVNIYNINRTFQVTARNVNGDIAGTTVVNLGPNQHLSFNLADRIPGLPVGFAGSIRITPSILATDQFLAWTLNVDNVNTSLVASLPPGPLAWPISHFDRIWLVFRKLQSVAPTALANLGITGVDLNSQGAVNLVISPEQVINAFGRPGVVQVDLSVSQLISDSPSELAFIVGHALGHVAQSQHGRTLLLPNAEQDADFFAMTLMVYAGFDPYAGAGALGKLSVVTGQSGLLSPTFDDLADPHASIATRIDSMFSTLSLTCAQPGLSLYCGAYKFEIHPNFPGNAPLSVAPPAARDPHGETR